MLSALSLVLNGVGLQQIHTVTSELVRVLDGREQNLHQFFGNLEIPMGELDQQRADIVCAIDGLDRLGTELAAQNGTLDRGIETITPAMVPGLILIPGVAHDSANPMPRSAGSRAVQVADVAGSPATPSAWSALSVLVSHEVAARQHDSSPVGIAMNPLSSGARLSPLNERPIL